MTGRRPVYFPGRDKTDKMVLKYLQIVTKIMM
jgi:hypothetical protein